MAIPDPVFLLMKKLSASGLILGSFLCCLCLVTGGVFTAAAGSLEEEKYPSPSGAVNDFAGVLSSDEEEALNQLAVELWMKTNVALVVAAFRSIEDPDLDRFAHNLYLCWGLGKARKERGVLALVVTDRQYALIVSGSDSRGLLSPEQENSIVRDHLTPALRRAEVGSGLLEGMRVIGQIIANDQGTSIGKAYQPQSSARLRGVGRLSGAVYLLGLAALLLIVLIPCASSRKKKEDSLTRPDGPLLGGFTGGFGSRFSGSFGNTARNQQRRRPQRARRPSW